MGMEIFLGIDAGGTKTAAAIIATDYKFFVDREGVGVRASDESNAADAATIRNPKSKIQNELGRGIGGPCSLATCDYATLTRSVREAARGACRAADLPEDTRFAGVCAGVAGYSLKSRRADFLAILAEEVSADCYDLVPDYEAAYWGASGGEPGVVVIAGTGSVAFGRNAQGETRKAGGLGYVLGDAGSGFALGRAALEIALKNLQSRHSENLSDAILASLGAASEEDVLTWLYQDFSPAKAASLAPILGKWAARKDETACELLREAAIAHRENVHQIRSRLLLSSETPIYPLGGLWQIGAFFREQFACPSWRASKEEEWAVPPLRYPVTEPEYDAARGAALFAHDKAKTQA